MSQVRLGILILKSKPHIWWMNVQQWVLINLQACDDWGIGKFIGFFFCFFSVTLLFDQLITFVIASGCTLQLFKWKMR